MNIISTCVKLRDFLLHLQLNYVSELACLEMKNGTVSTKHMFMPVNSPYFYYHGLAKRFFTDIAHKHRKLEGIALIVTSDDATLPYDKILRIREANIPFLAHSIQRKEAKKAILIPDWHFIESYGFKEIISQLDKIKITSPLEKRLPIVFWRGSTTGEPCVIKINGGQLLYKDCIRTCFGLQRTMLIRKMQNVSWADIKYSKAVQFCTKDELQSIYAQRVNEIDWTLYRGVIDIDGNVNAWGLHWRLHSGSVVFRVESDQINAYILHLKPNVHYVPILPNLSNVREQTSQITNVSKIREFTKMTHAAKKIAMKFTYDKEIARVAKELHHAWHKK
jgi:hypothetical protein